jgi:hypothetical protein
MVLRAKEPKRFSYIVVCWTKDTMEIFGEKLAQLVGC